MTRLAQRLKILNCGGYLPAAALAPTSPPPAAPRAPRGLPSAILTVGFMIWVHGP